MDYLGERTTFTPEQLMAMLMVDEKAIAETDGSPVTDCVIAIPAYFSAEERRAMLDASQIAGINCLRLMPETTATALAFGIYKTDLPEKDPINVVFVDVGYSCLQASPSCDILMTKLHCNSLTSHIKNLTRITLYCKASLLVGESSPLLPQLCRTL